MSLTKSDIRYKNLYDALTAHEAYCEYMFSYGSKKGDFENINFDLLQTIYSGFSLTQLMDKYLIKDGEKMVSTLIPEALKKLVEQVAVYNGNGYTIGELSYCDECKVLEKIRNKIAHGDFIIRDGEIIFEENGKEGRIKLNNFLTLVALFESEIENCTFNLPYTKVFNKICNKEQFTKITNEKEMDNLCSNLYRVEITDKPMFTARNMKYIEIMQGLYGVIEKALDAFDVEELDSILNDISLEAKKRGIELKVSIKNIKKLECYPHIKEKFIDEMYANEKLRIHQQVNRINNFAYILSNGQYQKKDIRKGFQLNRFLIEKLKENPELKMKEIIEQNPNISPLFLYHMDSAVISSILAGFNAIYEYGLEKGLTPTESNKLISLFEGKSIDFSKLDLEELDYIEDSEEREYTLDKTFEDIEMRKSKLLNEADRKISKTESILEQYKLNCKNQEEFRLVKLETDVKREKEEKKKIQIYYDELNEFLKELDLKEYTKNFNIITHMRNAIAHGNVFVDAYSMDIGETNVIFRDYDNDGKLVYEKVLNLKEFVLLFRTRNLETLKRFIKDNISDKTLIDGSCSVKKKKSF